MFFVIGTVLAIASVYLLALCYIGVRNPKYSKWTGDFLVGSIYIPGILMIMSFSAGAFYWVIKHYSSRPLTWVEVAEATLLLVASAVAWWLTGMGKTVKAYRQAENGSLIKVDFQKEETTTPPASGGKAA